MASIFSQVGGWHCVGSGSVVLALASAAFWPILILDSWTAWPRYEQGDVLDMDSLKAAIWHFSLTAATPVKVGETRGAKNRHDATLAAAAPHT